MKSRAKLVATLRAIVVLAVVGCWLYLDRSRAESSRRPAPRRAVAAPHPHVGATAAAPRLSREGTAKEGRAVPADFTAPQDKIFKNLITGQGAEIGLDFGQQDKFAADVCEFMAAYSRLQGEHATLESFDGTTLRIRVAPFPDQGKKLRDAFVARLYRDFPKQTADEIQDKVGEFLDRAFWGYGIVVQDYEVTRSDPNWPGRFRGAQFVIQSQSVVVPGLTPSRLPGDRWMHSMTDGNIQLTPEDLTSCQYQFLGPYILKTFGLPP